MSAGCRRCGRCCITAGCFIQASPGDLRRWEREGRQDILRHVSYDERHYSEHWRDPRTGETLDCCPFLRTDGHDRFGCGIHETRPQACREFSCILCEEAPSFETGDEVVFGLWDYVVSEGESCPKCARRGLCREHHYIGKDYLSRQIEHYCQRR